MVRAPRTVEFDHLPSDDEAAVFFAPRRGGCGYRIVDRGGVLRIESREFPTLVICAFMIVFVGSVVGFGDRFPNPMSKEDRVFFGFLGAMNVLIFLAIFVWLNRVVRGLNPLVEFDRGRAEIRLAERTEPIAPDDVVELIDWRLSFENAQALGFYRKFFGHEKIEPPHRHLMLLVNDGAVFRLEYLFHDEIDLYPRGKDPALVLATALNRPVRKITKSKSVRDMRPVDPFTKRF